MANSINEDIRYLQKGTTHLEGKLTEKASQTWKESSQEEVVSINQTINVMYSTLKGLET